MRILSIGEVLWDIFDTKRILGGAPLNFSLAAQRLGASVRLLTAVGDDESGHQAVAEMQRMGLATDFVQIVPGGATGTAVVTTDPCGNATFAIDRPAAYDLIDLNKTLLEQILEFQPDWIYFGTLAQAAPLGEERLDLLLSASPQTQCFYDINLRHQHWSLALVERLSKKAFVTKLNGSEAETLFKAAGKTEPFSIERFGRYWSTRYGSKIICITLGEHGCAVWADQKLEFFDGYPAVVIDTVGAGDAFAAAFLFGYGSGWRMQKAASFANALGAIVASHAGATPNWGIEECLGVMQATTNAISRS